jgi:YesN/AraC family two-component response regulator
MFEGHHHNIIEIYFLISGQRYYFIGDKAHLVMPRDLVIIPENVEHKVFSAGIGSYQRYILYTDRDFISENLKPDVANSLFDILARNKFVYKIKDPSTIELTFHKMLNLGLENPDTSSKKKVLSSLSTDILLAVEHSISILNASENEQELSYVNKNMLEIAEYINKNHAIKITLDDLAQKFNLSKYYLCKLFKKSIGLTFSEFLNNIRVTEAKNLLENTELSISQIAVKIGYKDAGFFCRVFKNIMGITALKYRKQTKLDI